MKKKLKIRIIITSILIEIIALFLGLVSAGAGHGNYIWAILFFPITMASFCLLNKLILPFVLFSIIQYPLYGILIIFLNKKRRTIAAVLIVIIHLISICICFFGFSHYF